ncbi:Cell division protein FtsQ [gamma proteobacterium HdN1]|nr:Cell division protein FtsQ [gamma proteobacterium HdN1]
MRQREKYRVRPQATRQLPPDQETVKTPAPLWRWIKMTSITVAVTGAALLGGLKGYDALQQVGEEYPIRTVKVYGDFVHIQPDHLKALLKPALFENFFQLDLAQVRADVQAMPWVEKAFLRKEWPDILVVKIDERTPVAHWDDHRLLGSDLSLFDQGEVHDLPDLPKLRGVERDIPVVWSRYQKLSEMLAPLSLTISEVIMAERYSWRVLLSDGMELVVDEKDWDQKMARFIKFYKKIPESERALLVRADLRYDNGLAVKWKKKDDNPSAA